MHPQSKRHPSAPRAAVTELHGGTLNVRQTDRQRAAGCTKQPQRLASVRAVFPFFLKRHLLLSRFLCEAIRNA